MPGLGAGEAQSQAGKSKMWLLARRGTVEAAPSGTAGGVREARGGSGGNGRRVRQAGASEVSLADEGCLLLLTEEGEPER